MKFLCVPCDSPMKLQTVGSADRGSLSIVYSCPECGYEMAMLTNPYETQMVQSLGVRVGPSTESAAGPTEASAATGGRCPFGAMIPGADVTVPAPDLVAVRWTAAAEARLANIPAFVRSMARTGIEQFARERGVMEVDDKILDAAREFFGM